MDSSLNVLVSDLTGLAVIIVNNTKVMVRKRTISVK